MKYLSSGLRIADELNAKLKLCWDSAADDNTTNEKYWIVEKESDLKFNELFSNKIPTIEKSKIPTDKINFYQEIVSKEIPNNTTIHGSKWLHFEDEPNIDYLGYTTREDCLRLRQKILPYLLSLKPVDSLQDKIDDFQSINNLGQKTIGIHVRRFHHEFVNIIPDNYYYFIDKLSGEFDKVFICTDSEEYQDDFIKHFPDCIFYPKSGFGTVDTMKNGEALIDMYLLSKCETIVSVYKSTFSEVSWWLSDFNSKMEIMTGKERYQKTYIAKPAGIPDNLTKCIRLD